MYLPESVLFCIHTLESAGFEAYVVGGCVRDALLGLIPQDYDLCTNALPADICRVFAAHTLVRSGEKHGTIGVVINKEVYEITTFRTEGDYLDSRHPEWVHFVSTVSEDLARRDFTINAIAYSPRHGYIDPWGGQADLHAHILRTVGDPTVRFSEDALRILRGVRFSVRYDLEPDPETERAMFALASTMDKLARERVFSELCKLLPLIHASQLLRFVPVLLQVIPELRPCVGFDQHSPHHIYDVFTHTAYVVESMPTDLALRWAALLHDIGKPDCFLLHEDRQGHFHGHAKLSARMADDILLRLKAPTVLRERVVLLIGQHMTQLIADKRLLRRRLGQYGEECVRQMLALQRGDFSSKGTGSTAEESIFAQIEALLEEVLAEQACFQIRDLQVDGHDMLALGLQGRAIGSCLADLLSRVQNEELPNEKAALLKAAERFRDRAIKF